MNKKILMILTAVLLVGITIPAFAAVRNVKVGGDITIRGIYRSNFDLIKDTIEKDTAGWLMTTTRIYVTSDLTDGVAVVVRFINERDWGADGFSENIDIDGDGDFDVIQRRTGSGIDLDLAYIQLSDVLVPGLTATLGRQEILLGEGFVVGNANPWGTARIIRTEDIDGDGDVDIEVETPINAWDYTARKAFDAIRLDYEVATVPLTLTGFVAKIDEQYAAVTVVPITLEADTGLDQNLIGINANYQLATAELEGYFIHLANARGTKNSANELALSTLGARIAHNIAAVPGLSWKGEIAFQSGDVGGEKAKGSAGYIGGNYAFQDITWEPQIGVTYFGYSGDDDLADDDISQWLTLFPDGCAGRMGAIGYAVFGPAPGTFVGLGGPVNEGGLQVIKVNGSIQPTEKLNLSLAWLNGTLLEVPAGTKKDVGNELDLGFTYAYSEDVAMGLLFGYFMKGDLIDQGIGTDSEDAMQVVGTVAVSF